MLKRSLWVSPPILEAMASRGPVVIISLAHSTLERDKVSSHVQVKELQERSIWVVSCYCISPSRMQSRSAVRLLTHTLWQTVCLLWKEEEAEVWQQNISPSVKVCVLRVLWWFVIHTGKFKTHIWMQVNLTSWHQSCI